MEVSNRDTVSITSGIFGDVSNGELYSLSNCSTLCNGVVSNSGVLSSTITLIFGTPLDCANRSIIRVSMRNNELVLGTILHIVLTDNTIVTRTNRFAGHTFLGNGLSLAGTRDVVKLVSTRDSTRLHLSHTTRVNGISRGVSGVRDSLISTSTSVTTCSSCPSRSVRNLGCSGFLTVLRGTGSRVRLVLGGCSLNGMLHRKVSAIVINGPGINGSALVGVLDNTSHSVIARVTNAAHSIVRSAMAMNSVGLHLTSATNVRGASSAIRDVNVGETGRHVSTTSLILTIFSYAAPLSGGSLSLLSCVGNGGAVVVVGGASLKGGVSLSRFSNFEIVRTSTGRNGKCSRLMERVTRVSNATGLDPSSTILVKRHRHSYTTHTLSTIGRTMGSLAVKLAVSTINVYISSTVTTLFRLANGHMAGTMASRVFEGFYING